MLWEHGRTGSSSNWLDYWLQWSMLYFPPRFPESADGCGRDRYGCLRDIFHLRSMPAMWSILYQRCYFVHTRHVASSTMLQVRAAQIRDIADKERTQQLEAALRANIASAAKERDELVRSCPMLHADRGTDHRTSASGRSEIAEYVTTMVWCLPRASSYSGHRLWFSGHEAVTSTGWRVRECMSLVDEGGAHRRDKSVHSSLLASKRTATHLPSTQCRVVWSKNARYTCIVLRR